MIVGALTDPYGMLIGLRTLDDVCRREVPFLGLGWRLIAFDGDFDEDALSKTTRLGFRVERLEFRQ